MRYVVFIETIMLYIDRGMKLTKLHRSIRFESKAMLAVYIKLNTTQRSVAGKDECKRNFFKLINVGPYREDNQKCCKTNKHQSSYRYGEGAAC